MLQQTHTQLLINGRWTDGACGRRLEVLNPANGTVVGTVACAGEPDLVAAVQAAVEGFRLWRRMPAFDRAEIMRKAAALLRERAETVARLMTLEQGKPIAESRAEVLNGAGTIEW